MGTKVINTINLLCMSIQNDKSMDHVLVVTRQGPTPRGDSHKKVTGVMVIPFRG